MLRHFCITTSSSHMFKYCFEACCQYKLLIITLTNLRHHDEWRYQQRSLCMGFIVISNMWQLNHVSCTLHKHELQPSNSCQHNKLEFTPQCFINELRCLPWNNCKPLQFCSIGWSLLSEHRKFCPPYFWKMNELLLILEMLVVIP